MPVVGNISSIQLPNGSEYNIVAHSVLNALTINIGGTNTTYNGAANVAVNLNTAAIENAIGYNIVSSIDPNSTTGDANSIATVEAIKEYAGTASDFNGNLSAELNGSSLEIEVGQVNTTVSLNHTHAFTPCFTTSKTNVVSALQPASINNFLSATVNATTLVLNAATIEVSVSATTTSVVNSVAGATNTTSSLDWR